MRQSNFNLAIPEDVLSVFERADQRCGFTKVLQEASYPPTGKILIPGNPEGENYRLKTRRGDTTNNDRCPERLSTPAIVEASIRDCNGGCATATTAQNYLAGAKPW